jgi:hypothetical protein
LFFQNLERQRAILEHSVMKFALIECENAARVNQNFAPEILTIQMPGVAPG